MRLARTAALRLLPCATGFGGAFPHSQSGRDERDTEQERQPVLDRLVRVDARNDRRAHEQADDARNGGADQVARQEGNAVRPRTIAADHDEGRRQRKRAGRSDECVEENMKARTDHVAGHRNSSASITPGT